MRNSQLFVTDGSFFMQSFEICLVGYKCPPGEYVEYNSKISNNLIFSEALRNKQKPNEIYEIIELMMPGAKKIELFAKNQNLRPGWFALGNKIGDSFDKWFTKLECNECGKIVNSGIKRYKSKKTANYDICENCFKPDLNPQLFYEFKNDHKEDVAHYYFACSQCKTQPIIGPRFQCQTCVDYDICEYCYDLNLHTPDLNHDISHEFDAIEYQTNVSALSLHKEKK